jgi:transcription antitermination factor NusG
LKHDPEMMLGMKRTLTDWYALHVFGNYDRWLRRHGLEPMVPTERRITYTTRHHASLRRRTETPLFPGLAFVEIPPDGRGEVRWDRILAIPFVRSVFAPHGIPHQFRAADMAILGELGNRPAVLPYGKGDGVRFVSGPMRDVDFTVASVDFRAGEVKLLAEIMGRVAEITGRASDVRRQA